MSDQPFYVNTGNYPDDSTGTPLRTAFQGINNNFSQIWSAGLVNSNLTISNNTIQSSNLNGQLILATNGTGQVVVATNFMPDMDRVRNIGAPNNRFKTLYVQAINATNQAVTGNLRVTGNLQVTGNLSYINVSNVNVANVSMTLGANAISPADVNDGGIYLAGANASITYQVADNSWHSNIPFVAQGNVTTQGGYFIGDGGLLSNVSASSAAALVTGNTLSGNVAFSSLTTVGILANLQVANFVSAGYYVGDGGNLSNISGTNIVGNVANAAFSTYSGTANRANAADIATLAINANNALYALESATAERATWSANAEIAQHAVFSDAAGTANTASIASAALLVTGNDQPYITSVGTLANLRVAGGANLGSIYTDNYYYANGAPISFGNSTYGNANVETLLADGIDTNIETTANVAGNNLSFTNLYVGNTLFTRTLVVGTRTVPVTVPLASNNSFNVLGRDGANITVYTS